MRDKVAFETVAPGRFFRFGRGEEFAINQRLKSARPAYVTLETGVVHECEPDVQVVPVQAWVVEA